MNDAVMRNASRLVKAKPLNSIDNTMSNHVITPTKLAKRWDVSLSTIYRMEKRGELPPRKKIYRSAAWFESDIEEFEATRPEVEPNGMELVK